MSMPTKSIYADIRRSVRIQERDAAASPTRSRAIEPSTPRALQPSAAGKTRSSLLRPLRFDPYSNRRADREDETLSRRRVFVVGKYPVGELSPCSPFRKGSIVAAPPSSPLAREYRPTGTDDEKVPLTKADRGGSPEENGKTVTKENREKADAKENLAPTNEQMEPEKAHSITESTNTYASAVADAFASQRTPTLPDSFPEHVHAEQSHLGYDPLNAGVGLADARRDITADGDCALPTAVRRPRPEYDPSDPAAGMAEAEWRWRAYEEFKTYLKYPETQRHRPETFLDPFW